MKKRQKKFVVLSNLPDDVYMVNRQGYSFITDRVGQPKKAQQLCQLLNRAFQAERARVRRLVRKLANQSQSFDVQEFTVTLLNALKEGR